MVSFTMSRADVVAYARANQYATMMFLSAGDDYAASRCLILNSLGMGFGLFSQSIEKLLKACIFLETGSKTTLKWAKRHHPLELKQELQSKVDYGLDKYDALLQRLYGHFQRRYFDNANQSNGANSAELDQFDELWIYLVDRTPLPTEVKYRSKFVGMLFSENGSKYWPSYRHWVLLRNKAIANKLEQMEKTYFAVKKHLYPKGVERTGGRRPALVLSPRLYNERSALALVCPVTSRVKGYPF